jgi:formylglycine-generating enzyme required for sulfatase activity
LLLLSGIFQGFVGEPEIIEVTSPPIVMVMSSTPDPNASPEVLIITATPEPTSEAAIVLPSPTPVVVIQETTTTSVEATTTVVQPTTTSNSDTTQNTGASAQNITANIPAELQGIASGLITVQGNVFQLGTDNVEILQAAQTCINEHGGQCDPQNGEDSTPRVTVQLSTFQLEQTEVSFNQYVAFLNWQNSQGLRHTSACSGFLCIQTANERSDAAVIAFDGANYFIPTRLQNLENHPVYGVTWYGARAAFTHRSRMGICSAWWWSEHPLSLGHKFRS